MGRTPLFKNPDVAVGLGAAAMAAAAFCFYDAFERRGKKRPFVVRWLGV